MSSMNKNVNLSSKLPLRCFLLPLKLYGCENDIYIKNVWKRVQSPEASVTVDACQNRGAQGICRVSLYWSI